MKDRYNKQWKARKAIGIFFMVIFFLSLFSFIVMWLWNAILPGVIHVSPINFWQSLGILVLSKILFSGFGRGGGWQRKRQEWKRRMFDKWQDMTPEDREKFKQSWKMRCESWGRRPFSQPNADRTGEPGAE